MKPTPYMVGPNFQALNRLEANDDFELQAQVLNTLRLLQPQAVRGFRKARFGSVNDGGYVHLDDFTGVDTVLSLGIEHNIDWDREIAEQGLPIHQFDYSVDAPAPDDSRMIFHKVMIGPQAGPGVESLESLVERFDKKRERPNIFLKMDIECSEWAVIEATSLETISRFSQIACEMHYFQGLSDTGWRQACFRALRKLSKFYAPIHVHANNCADFTMIANVPVPEVLEVTFANRAIYEFEESDEIFPGPLDAPCDPKRPDLFLGSFRYRVESNKPAGQTPPSATLDMAVRAPSGTPIPDEWQARADAATARRERLDSFGPHAAGILVSTTHGPMVVDAEDNSVSAVLLANGSYADHEYEFARSLITTNSTVLVVGAHIGAHVVRLAKHCRELIAVEANPRTFALLEANVRLQSCDNVRLLNVAAGEKDGSIKFLMNRDNSGGSKREPVNNQFFYVYDQPDVVEVECKRLDGLLPEETHFDLIFMDIEGSEYFALQGMQKILSRCKALSIEFLVHHLRDVAAVEIDDFSALIIPHFAWMFTPDTREFVAQADMASRMREMYAAGQNYDCVYFLKDLSPKWLEEQGLPDPRA